MRERGDARGGGGVMAWFLIGAMVVGLVLIVLGWRSSQRDGTSGGELGVMLGLGFLVIGGFAFFGVPLVAVVFDWWF